MGGMKLNGTHGLLGLPPILVFWCFISCYTYGLLVCNIMERIYPFFKSNFNIYVCIVFSWFDIYSCE